MEANTVALLTAALAGGAAGAGISGALTFFGQWLNRRSENRRYFLDLCFKAATENLIRDTQATKTCGGTIAPLDLYLIHMLSLMRISTDSNLSQEKMIAEWVRISRNTREAFESAVKQELDRRKQNTDAAVT